MQSFFFAVHYYINNKMQQFFIVFLDAIRTDILMVVIHHEPATLR
jgi:hypothetical protein